MDPKINELYASSLHPENPFLYACGSGKGQVFIWMFD